MARPARKKKKERLNLDLPEGAKLRLERLRDSTHADSLSEVVRRALAVYELVSRENIEGSKFIIRSEDGSERHLEIL